MSKLNREAINEITHLLKEVQDVVELLEGFGIDINSDCWTATSFNEDLEDILNWKKENFENINGINKGDTFYIGGNIITGSQHLYKNKWIIAPKKLAEVQGEIFKEYLESIIKSTSLKHFNLKFKDEYGLVDSCGWEHQLIIETTVKESALIDSPTKKLLEQLKKDFGYDYIYDVHKDASSINNIEGYHPKYAYMIERFSELVEPSHYESNFGVTDEYIDKVVEIRDDMRQLAMEVEHYFEDENVKATLGKWNEGCEYGMVLYIWIPYQ